MKKYLVIFALFAALLRANQYDYLLYSYVISDVESGINLQADVNARINNITPLYEAVKNNRLEIAYILIMNRADVNAINNGETALMRAAMNANAKMVQLLIMAGANVNAKDSQFENTALHYAAANADRQSINALTNANADMNAPNMYGITPAKIALAEVVVPPMVIEDLNVAISASAFKVAASSVIFNMRNLTNEPLNIMSVDLYINGVLVSRSGSALIIPAGSTITNVNEMPIPPHALNVIKIDKNGTARIKAGFSVRYYAEGRVQNAFNSTEFMVQLWNPPINNVPKPRDSRPKEAQDSK